MKVCVSSNLRNQEQKIQDHLRNLDISNDGQYCVRKCEDSFVLESFSGHHQCYVYEPLGMSLLDYVNLQQDLVLNKDDIHWIVKHLLTGLDYLHCCNIVHTGRYFIHQIALPFLMTIRYQTRQHIICSPRE